jgi:isoleucyl-tRNA synthetase
MDAKMKVRQPLPVVEVVLADESHKAFLSTHLSLISEELNVKSVEFASDADKYVTYEIKPNFKSLGPKFGKLAPQIKKALAGADAATMRRELDEQGKTSLEVGGETVELTADDAQVTLKAKEGWSAAQGPQVVVVLSTELTDELKREGLARDLVHFIQTARKTEQLDYQARIRLSLNVSGALAEAVEAHKDYISGETLTADLSVDASLADAKHSGEIEGMPVQMALEVVS